MPDGTRFLETPAEDFYILPLDKAPTLDRMPVLEKCSGSQKTESDKAWFQDEWCRGTYILPSGIVVTFKYPRTKYAPLTPLQIDLKRRARIQHMIDAAKFEEQK